MEIISYGIFYCSKKRVGRNWREKRDMLYTVPNVNRSTNKITYIHGIIWNLLLVFVVITSIHTRIFKRGHRSTVSRREHSPGISYSLAIDNLHLAHFYLLRFIYPRMASMACLRVIPPLEIARLFPQSSALPVRNACLPCPPRIGKFSTGSQDWRFPRVENLIH